jgi:hypothetical protein
MKWKDALTDHFGLLHSSLCFFRRYFTIIIGLGLIAAFGRVAQLGGFGPIATWLNIVLEVLIETARILLFLFVLGIANIERGLGLLKRVFLGKINLKSYKRIVVQKFKAEGIQILCSVLGFLVVAWLINYWIDVVAYETCLYVMLKSRGILEHTSSEWTIILFFKNVLTIPFTLIFEAVFFLWITGKIRRRQFAT